MKKLQEKTINKSDVLSLDDIAIIEDIQITNKKIQECKKELTSLRKYLDELKLDFPLHYKTYKNINKKEE